MFNSCKKQRQDILKKYQCVKNSSYNFERISSYFNNKDKSNAYQVLDDRTLQDLDFEELFMYLDRTMSLVGQQYLYSILRTIPKNKNQAKIYEQIIERLDQKIENKEAALLELNRLNKPGAYYIQRLIFSKSISRPKWHFLIPILSCLCIIAFTILPFYPVILLFILPLVIVNLVLHFWNKSNILGYSNTIPQLLILHQVTKNLFSLNLVINDKEQIQSSIKVLDKIARLAIFFKWESRMDNEIGQAFGFIIDLIRGIFLLETLLFFNLIKKIDLCREEINILFSAVAQVDVAISISSLRQSLPYFVLPEFVEKEKSWHSNAMYHPLITDPISNDLTILYQKSVLISGSNMSGKTTFIRTIGINALLSQTINTAFAKEFKIPRYKIFSAIRISDDLLEQTSYYYEEVKTNKKLIQESFSSYPNLFLLDELFKGTNTVERIASGKAVLSFLDEGNNLAIASTHDLELTEFLSDRYDYFHFSEMIENDILNFDYKLKSGRLINTNAIRILEINGYPVKLTNEAKDIAQQLNELKISTLNKLQQ